MKLSIDFGTCYSSAALFINGTPRPIKEPLSHSYSFPSSIFITEQGKLLVGQAAENARKQDLKRYRREFKRDLGCPNPIILGDTSLFPEDLVKTVLRELKQQANKVLRGKGEEELNSVVLTIPATYRLDRRELMKEAAKDAGFKTVELLEEPIAAASYYAQESKVNEGEIILVYDLGGGTFDATLLQKQGDTYQIVGVPRGLSNCGGTDFDRLIFQDLKARCNNHLREQLKRKDAWLIRAIVADYCYDLKHQLSQAEEATIYIPLGLGEVESYSLTQSAFNKMIAPLIEETLDCCDQLLRSAGKEWSQINQVLLVGGSCRIPYVQEAVGKKLGRSPLLVDDPELAVCFGATLNANQPVKNQTPFSQSQFSSPLQTFTFEIITVNDRGNINHRREGKAQQMVEDLGNGVLLEMVAIPRGRFLMGSPKTEKQSADNERPQHRVEVPPFLMGKYPITQAQYQAIMGENPSRFSGANNPVEKVSWYKAKEFCKRLSKKTGRKYRLPSEAEWEYACRAGTTTPFHFGGTITTDLANYDGNRTYGKGPKGIYRVETTPVGSFHPNAFGLYDMHGNVWEWCLDNWHNSYEGGLNDGKPWLTAGDHGDRVLRGGSWVNNPSYCRCALRIRSNPNDDGNNNGFRVVSSAVRTF